MDVSEVDEIKKRLDIVTVINKILPLKKRGRHYIACCPFHSEKTPSFTVSPELQIYKCFGCGKAGDIFSFFQEYHRIDFREALEELAKIAGVTLTHSALRNQADSRKKRLIDINYQVAKFYHYMLISHPLGKKALDYVLGRGISLDTVKLFKIGYSPENPQYISDYLNKKGYPRDDIFATGSFGQSHYGRNQLYDRFSGRLIFPLSDYRDRILGFSGRVLPFAKNPNQAKYINSPETDIYHKSQMLFGLNLSKEAVKSEESVVITEGEFDMIAPFQSGVKNIVAIKGTAFTQDQLQLLKRYTDTLILALDSDFAGNNAALKSIELADSMEFDIQVLSLGEKYKDPDEAIQSDKEFFLNQLKHTLPVWDFVINSALKTYDVDTPKGKKQFLTLVLPFIGKISNSVIRSDYLHKIANLLGSELNSLLEEVQKYQTTRVVASSQVVNPTAVSTSMDRMEESLLALILSARNPPKIFAKNSSLDDCFTSPKHQKIVAQIKNLPEYDPKLVLSLLPPELQPTFETIFLEASALTIDSVGRQKQIKKLTNQILTIQTKNELSRLGKEIARLESINDDSQLSQVEVKYNQLLTKLSSLQVRKS